MRTKRLLSILLLAIVLVLTADARRSGGSSSRSSSRSSYSYSRSSYGGNYGYRGGGSYYSGMVIIAGPGGSYYYGYGQQCPSGCAVNGQCGTQAECTVATVASWIFLVFFFAIFCGIFCCRRCARDRSDDNHVHVHHDGSKSSEDRERLEPIVGGQGNPEAAFMQQPAPYGQQMGQYQ